CDFDHADTEDFTIRRLDAAGQLSNLASVEQERRWRFRQTVQLQRNDGLCQPSATFHPSDDLLSGVAAFIKADLIPQTDFKGNVIGAQFPPYPRTPCADSQRVIGQRASGEQSERLSGFKDCSPYRLRRIVRDDENPRLTHQWLAASNKDIRTGNRDTATIHRR